MVRIGPIAFFIFLIAGLSTAFNIVSLADPRTLQVALFLVLSIGLMSLMKPQIYLSDSLSHQIQVGVFGIYGAFGLIISQLLISNIQFDTINAALYAAIAEECMFSGFAYAGLRKILPRVNWSIVAFILGIAFASLHAIAYQLTIPLLLILILGRIILYWAFESTQDLGAPMLGHLIVNAMASGVNIDMFMILRFLILILIIVLIVMLVIKR